MTKRFWFHFIASCAISSSVLLMMWIGRDSPVASAASGGAVSAGSRAGILLAVLGLLYVLARLLLRVTGSDRATGLLGLYAVALYLPFVSVLTRTIVHPVVFMLVAGAVLELLDVDVAPANAVRAGFYLSFACILAPGAAVIAGALVPVVAALSGRRWTLPIRFVLAVALPWAAATALGELLPWAGSPKPLGEALSGFKVAEAARKVLAGSSEVRVLWDSGFQSVYAAFCFAGLVAGSIKRIGPSRRGVAAVAWLLLVTALAAGVLGKEAGFLYPSFAYLFFIVLANAGLCAMAALNPLHAGRRRMIPVGVFFMIPQVVGWVRYFA
jgi:hypothetical protein